MLFSLICVCIPNFIVFDSLKLKKSKRPILIVVCSLLTSLHLNAIHFDAYIWISFIILFAIKWFSICIISCLLIVNNSYHFYCVNICWYGIETKKNAREKHKNVDFDSYYFNLRKDSMSKETNKSLKKNRRKKLESKFGSVTNVFIHLL